VTWADHAARITRTPLTVVEVDLDWIDDAGVTATNPDATLCYRTPATTDQGTFSIVTKTRKWQTATTRALPELGAIPCLESARYAAEEIKIGSGLGSFGQVTITLSDFVDDDARSEDPFATDTSRSGRDLSAGTYLSKLLARNPWWTGRALRVIEGWATDGVWHPSDTTVRHFLVRDVQGPSAGTVTITAVGPLQLLNLDNTEAPSPSEGVLLSDISDSATAATIHDPVIAGDYPASGLLRCGDEVMSYTRSGQALTLTRAQLGTKADEHSADDALQVVLRYTDEPIVDIIEDLLTTYGGVDPALLDLSGWALEQSLWLPQYDLSGVVSSPTKVLDLVRELLEASGSVLWWDDSSGLVRLRAIRPALSTVATWSERLNLLGSPDQKRDMGQRVSRCDIAIDLRSADKDPKAVTSYRARVLGVSAGDGDDQHGSEKIKLIATRWISSSQTSLAIRASWLVTNQLRDGRQTISVEVSAKDATAKLGDVVSITDRDIVDRTGQPVAVRAFVVRREAVATGSRYRYLLERLALSGSRFIYLCDTGLPAYASASAAQRDPGWFLAGAGGAAFGPNDPPYVLG
jgi:hypothetical protein